jgi:oligopeptide/dipeptide ABC transporter ATP-binding protein
MSAGGSLGLVGESGSGKTIFCRALLGTLDRHGARVVRGTLTYKGRDFGRASERVWRRIRGSEIAYVPQSSLASLNPVLTVAQQLTSVIRLTEEARGHGRTDLRRRALALLESVEIPRAEQVLDQRPIHLSGGMRQRVVIAAAIARSPSLLVADEPTTALDVRVQRRILDLLGSLRQRLGLALLLVSHDLAVIEEMCESVAVMYAGSIVEMGRREQIMSDPKHPYTDGLLSATIGSDGGREPIPGEVPNVGAWPDGCKFWPRCPLTRWLGGGSPRPECHSGERPSLRVVVGRSSACLFAEAMDGRPTIVAHGDGSGTP